MASRYFKRIQSNENAYKVNKFKYNQKPEFYVCRLRQKINWLVKSKSRKKRNSTSISNLVNKQNFVFIFNASFVKIFLISTLFWYLTFPKVLKTTAVERTDIQRPMISHNGACLRKFSFLISSTWKHLALSDRTPILLGYKLVKTKY